MIASTDKELKKETISQKQRGFNDQNKVYIKLKLINIIVLA